LIFVIMGMEVHPFDRLARAVDDLAAAGEEDFLIQLGACAYAPRHARHERYMSFGELCENVRASTVVITHAGAGSTLVCIQQGKHPIMVPRRSRWGEHVDEHQVPFAKKLSEGGLATTVEDMTELPAAIAAVRGKAGRAEAMGRASELSAWLESFWRSLSGRPRG
jgi:UDP-N-acetylglucosamine transferase subunit ALG13